MNLNMMSMLIYGLQISKP